MLQIIKCHRWKGAEGAVSGIGLLIVFHNVLDPAFRMFVDRFRTSGQRAAGHGPAQDEGAHVAHGAITPAEPHHNHPDHDEPGPADGDAE
eukprot:8953774-Pyramimonas_sp.AAC.1